MLKKRDYVRMVRSEFSDDIPEGNVGAKTRGENPTDYNRPETQTLESALSGQMEDLDVTQTWEQHGSCDAHERSDQRHHLSEERN